MERLKERIEMATKALSAFREIIHYHEVNDIVRDAAIQRFEFTFEASWKAAKQYLYDIEGLDLGSPKGVIRCCREVGLLSDDETILALKMVDNRNLTVHTYNEELSLEIFQQLPAYLDFIEKWLKQIEKRC
ncbi:nucleotidyltransferase [Gracilibacillus boraciitolerans JCM 21714]|uniref:Nucleotidyltransferase n=1 Tax=Gracilibacillus boraciitolerans JCM 21714 TaxID=1298598 RepID=W4VN27_9BACI|nr:HI0074 family nucleotidyltransferase substrate-binding subunit [Gracilibacillus boraciitolerans]GAE94592.1 nucleotidyltransferase [Gracilibacillus boraciitolerans JCM 21714]